ncbi:glycerate kinase [Luteipulveratus sp. YIM 133132]|uniref:Glycerate kinase n=1 Tax=Luteipulveratus flavus TaxID=3031728 RepID=A0ABT6C8C3_9MICO|nr:MULTISPECIES: glycerate kinase [unclassified Luteipulveratus]MDE9366416.1 glycerate kinase [Luteipulveratus sp. YIM 133132]MDF8264309.1 glycerate kinase [Luteipulveratus sp. YIM 133296]
MVTVLVAPAGIGHLPPVRVAELVSQTWTARSPGVRVVGRPMSDGGNGFLDALRAGAGGVLTPVVVDDPSGPSRPATVLLQDGANGPTAYVEPAALNLGAEDSTYAVGRLLIAARETGAERIVVGVGYMGTLDGGAGMLRALAGDERSGDWWRAPDRTAALVEEWGGVRIVGAVEDDAPLLGMHGPTYAAIERSGLDRAEADRHERRMGELVDQVEKAVPPRRDLVSGLPVRVHRRAGAGAGGGLGYALAVLGAQLRSGADVTAEAVGLDHAVADADLVVTGETTYDWRSLEHSVLSRVSSSAEVAARPVVVLCREQHVGRRESMSLGVAGTYSLIPTGRLARDVPEGGDLEDALRALVRRVAGTWTPTGSDDVH